MHVEIENMLYIVALKFAIVTMKLKDIQRVLMMKGKLLSDSAAAGVHQRSTSRTFRSVDLSQLQLT